MRLVARGAGGGDEARVGLGGPWLGGARDGHATDQRARAGAGAGVAGLGSAGRAWGARGAERTGRAGGSGRSSNAGCAGAPVARRSGCAGVVAGSPGCAGVVRAGGSRGAGTLARAAPTELGAGGGGGGLHAGDLTGVALGLDAGDDGSHELALRVLATGAGSVGGIAAGLGQGVAKAGDLRRAFLSAKKGQAKGRRGRLTAQSGWPAKFWATARPVAARVMSVAFMMTRLRSLGCKGSEEGGECKWERGVVSEWNGNRTISGMYKGARVSESSEEDVEANE